MQEDYVPVEDVEIREVRDYDELKLPDGFHEVKLDRVKKYARKVDGAERQMFIFKGASPDMADKEAITSTGFTLRSERLKRIVELLGVTTPGGLRLSRDRVLFVEVEDGWIKAMMPGKIKRG